MLALTRAMGPESTVMENNPMTNSNNGQAGHGVQQIIQTESGPPYVVNPKKGERSRSG